uniref:Cell cycle checkpoint protein RAD17 n=1 Tax=Panagrolaimus sp. PS1159 TaxID=55785 RepID=A0AC35FG21_9BILA
MENPFARVSQIRDTFRTNKSSSQLSTGKKFLPSKGKGRLPSSTSESKLSTLRSTPSAIKRPIIQRDETIPKVKWFKSSFDKDDDIQILDERPPPKKKNKLDNRKVVAAEKENIERETNLTPIIACVFEPKSVEELAVNTKKITEVTEWIQSMMTPAKARKILLLSGPCGTGKTTTLKLICAELGVDFLEFDLPQEGEYNDDEFNKFDNYIESKPIEVFEKYIKSCEFISTEPGALEHRLLCIENIPNVFYREPGKLKESLLRCAASTRCMIVFVMSTTEKGWDFHPARLLPPAVLNELQITEIKFNSIAPGIMTKAVNNMLYTMGIKATSSMVRDIVEQAEGDIRSAINNIQFSTFNKSYKGGLATSVSHLNIFHYIGKILYAKRADSSTQEWRNTENKLMVSKWKRQFPPKDNLNYLIDNCTISGSRLADFIHEHEPNFAPTITACSRVFRDICEYDACQPSYDYERSSMINKYYTDITVRTTIFNNYQCAAGQAKVTRSRQAYTFKKPQLTEMNKTRTQTKINLLKLLPRLRTADLFMSTVPLLPRTRFFMRPEEKKIVNALSLRDKVSTSSWVNTSSWGGINIKVNPRPLSTKNPGKDSARTKPYMADEETEKEEDFVIDESDDEDSFFN